MQPFQCFVTHFLIESKCFPSTIFVFFPSSFDIFIPLAKMLFCGLHFMLHTIFNSIDHPRQSESEWMAITSVSIWLLQCQKRLFLLAFGLVGSCLLTKLLQKKNGKSIEYVLGYFVWHPVASPRHQYNPWLCVLCPFGIGDGRKTPNAPKHWCAFTQNVRCANGLSHRFPPAFNFPVEAKKNSMCVPFRFLDDSNN